MQDYTKIQRLVISCVYSWSYTVNIFTTFSLTVLLPSMGKCFWATVDFFCNTTGSHLEKLDDQQWGGGCHYSICVAYQPYAYNIPIKTVKYLSTVFECQAGTQDRTQRQKCQKYSLYWSLSTSWQVTSSNFEISQMSGLVVVQTNKSTNRRGHRRSLH